MKNRRILAIAAGAIGAGSIGCADTATSTPETSISAVVAPLDLPAASDACYQLTVWNVTANQGEASEVWDQPSLCASQYGANNGIRFTGICDADAGENSIRLVLNDIYTGGTFETGTALTAGTDYINPCPAPTTGEDNGCILITDCEPNQDTLVEFNLTVMRQAQLGFFDTVVRLSDVFCAAKLDCVDQNNEALTYLYNVDEQADGETAVLGFTCLGGSGDDISMYLDNVVVTCRNGGGTITRTATIDPTDGPGNVDPVQTGATDFLFGAAVNTGEGFQGSRFWNVLLGINGSVAGETCTLTTVGTVSETALTGTPFETPEHTRYPFIEWDIELSADGARSCERHPLNGGNGVSTEYSGIDAPETFAHRLTTAVVCPCWDATTGAAQIAAIAAETDYARNYNAGTILSFTSVGLGQSVSFAIEGEQCRYSGGAWTAMTQAQALQCASVMGEIFAGSPAP